MVVVDQARETAQPDVTKEAVVPKYRRQTSNVLANQSCSISTQTIDGEANTRFAEYECQKHHHGAIDRGTEAMEEGVASLVKRASSRIPPVMHNYNNWNCGSNNSRSKDVVCAMQVFETNFNYHANVFDTASTSTAMYSTSHH